MCGGGRDWAQICLLFMCISHSTSRQNWGVCAKSCIASLRQNQSLSPGSLSPYFLLPACSWQLVCYGCWIRTQKFGVIFSSTTYCVSSVYFCFSICKIGPVIKHYDISMRIEIRYLTCLAKLPVFIVFFLILITLPLTICSVPTKSL